MRLRYDAEQRLKHSEICEVGKSKRGDVADAIAIGGRRECQDIGSRDAERVLASAFI